MATQEPVLHTQYMYKPKGSNAYVKIYFEAGLSDVVIDDDKQSTYFEAKTLDDLVKAMVAKLNQCAPKVLMTWSYSVDKNAIYPEGQIIYEQDTGIIKIGDGQSIYTDLGHAKGSISMGEINLDKSVSPIIELVDGETQYDLNTVATSEVDDDIPSDGTATFRLGSDLDIHNLEMNLTEDTAKTMSNTDVKLYSKFETDDGSISQEFGELTGSKNESEIPSDASATIEII